MSEYEGVPRNEVQILSASGNVKLGSGELHGWFVNTAVATGAVTLTDGMPSATTLLVIPVGAAAGTYQAGLDIGFATKCYATFAGTGNITFIFR
jgi:hypothetical protein